MHSRSSFTGRTSTWDYPKTYSKLPQTRSPFGQLMPFQARQTKQFRWIWELPGQLGQKNNAVHCCGRDYTFQESNCSGLTEAIQHAVSPQVQGRMHSDAIFFKYCSSQLRSHLLRTHGKGSHTYRRSRPSLWLVGEKPGASPKHQGSSKHQGSPMSVA